MWGFRSTLLALAFCVVPTLAYSVELLGIKIGTRAEDVARVVGVQPSAISKIGGNATARSFLLGNGLRVSVTHNNSTKRVVYAEVDWESGEPVQIPEYNVVLGKTTLDELRIRFKSNGFSYTKRLGGNVDKGVVLFNSYHNESNKDEVVTFISLLKKEDFDAAKKSNNLGSLATLDAVVIESDAYTSKLAGKKIYDSDYQPVPFTASESKRDRYVCEANGSTVSIEVNERRVLHNGVVGDNATVSGRVISYSLKNKERRFDTVIDPTTLMMTVTVFDLRTGSGVGVIRGQCKR